MAESPAHKFGQIVGDMLEVSVEPMFREFANRHSLYLDKRGPRPARKGSKVSWVDLYGNTHDLDFVFERSGTDMKIGTPVAFIESAWRRYTKHSRNKAQEIQGAILPLISAHRNSAPFFGVILAGVFTDGALSQLKSVGFKVMYFHYESVVKAFKLVGIDASFDEETPDAEFAKKVHAWESLSKNDRSRVAKALVEMNPGEVNGFLRALEHSVTRRLDSIRILPLHGAPSECSSIEEALKFINGYDDESAPKPLTRYEILIRYSSGDTVEGSFATKEDALEFLRSYQMPSLRPM